MAKQITKPTPLKYCLGNDISKDQMSVCFSQVDGQQHVSIKGTHKFSNTLQGWKALQTWIVRLRKHLDVPLVLVVEATGVYYEGFAYYFRDQGFDLHVVLPNKSKHYAKSLNIKTKNDDVDARLLAQMGLERQLSVWRGMTPTMLKIKQLCRQRHALQQDRTAVTNQLHAHTYAQSPLKLIVEQMHRHLELLNEQIQELETQAKAICADDPHLQQRVENICTIKGVGIMTALVIIAETNGFDLIENKAQLVSFVGYDVVENQSGSSLNGKTRISKKGNSHIRRALHFPALTAARYEPKLQNLYQRVLDKNPKIKMIGAVAVQRKLLVLIYTLYKKNEPYDPNFEKLKSPHEPKKVGKTNALPTQHSSPKAACFV